MGADVCSRLLEVVPGTAAYVARLPAGERFEWVWSVLGSHRVRDLLRDDPSLAVARRATALGVISDARQLAYLDIPAARHLATVVARYGHLDAAGRGTRTGLVDCLRQVMAASPGGVTALLAALAEADDGTARSVEKVLAEERAEVLASAAQGWLAAPGLLPLTLRLADEPGGLGLLGEVAREVGGLVLPNVPFDGASVGGEFVEQVSRRTSAHPPALSMVELGEVATGVLHQVFRPVSLTYAETRTVLEQVGDWHDHVPSAGLVRGGRHWSPGRGCYEFRHVARPGGLRCYLSKNAPSALAKGSVGICTAQDLDLFRRADHHHLNLVDATTGVVVGNAQLHLLTAGPARVLLIRAINASNTYLARHSARTVVEAVLVSCVELAAASGLDEVHLGEGLSFWHLNSSRPRIRAVLDQLYDRLPVVFLDRPFFLFRFGNVDLQVAKTYQVWAHDPTAVDGFRLRHFVRAVV
jgi:hypothetical protein